MAATNLKKTLFDVSHVSENYDQLVLPFFYSLLLFMIFLLLVAFVYYELSFTRSICLLWPFFYSFRLFRQLMLLRQQGFGYWHSKHLPLFAFTLWIDGCDSIMDKQRWKIQGRGPFYSWQRGLDVKNSIWDALIWGFVNTYYFKIFHV